MRPMMLVPLTALLAAARLPAQAGDGHSRTAQIQMLEYQRKTLLAMTDSMPERLYRDKATPAQRDFAQQIHHAASTAAYIASVVLKGGPANLPDTAATFAGRTGLERYVNGAFDFAAGVLKGQSATARTETVKLFGQSMPGWQVWDEIYTHTIWTVGQIVANFRKNGMAPPSFTFF
jgi:hypothetical protein